jgi:hypothetical protein
MNELAAKIAFNDSIELSARLASFATARFHSLGTNSTIESVSEELAHRDVLGLALSLRRLSEIALLQKELQSCEIPEVGAASPDQQIGFFPIGKLITLHRLIGILIHSLTFELYKNSGKVRVHLSQGNNDVFEDYKLLVAGEHIDAVCLVQSDKSGKVLFPLKEFVAAALKFLDVAQTRLSDEGVYVGLFEME